MWILFLIFYFCVFGFGSPSSTPKYSHSEGLFLELKDIPGYIPPKENHIAATPFTHFDGDHILLTRDFPKNLSAPYVHDYDNSQHFLLRIGPNFEVLYAKEFKITTKSSTEEITKTVRKSTILSFEDGSVLFSSLFTDEATSHKSVETMKKPDYFARIWIVLIMLSPDGEVSWSRIDGPCNGVMDQEEPTLVLPEKERDPILLLSFLQKDETLPVKDVSDEWNGQKRTESKYFANPYTVAIKIGRQNGEFLWSKMVQFSKLWGKRHSDRKFVSTDKNTVSFFVQHEPSPVEMDCGYSYGSHYHSHSRNKEFFVVTLRSKDGSLVTDRLSKYTFSGWDTDFIDEKGNFYRLNYKNELIKRGSDGSGAWTREIGFENPFKGIRSMEIVKIIGESRSNSFFLQGAEEVEEYQYEPELKVKRDNEGIFLIKIDEKTGRKVWVSRKHKFETPSGRKGVLFCGWQKGSERTKKENFRFICSFKYSDSEFTGYGGREGLVFFDLGSKDRGRGESRAFYDAIRVDLPEEKEEDPFGELILGMMRGSMKPLEHEKVTELPFVVEEGHFLVIEEEKSENDFVEIKMKGDSVLGERFQTISRFVDVEYSGKGWGFWFWTLFANFFFCCVCVVVSGVLIWMWRKYRMVRKEQVKEMDVDDEYEPVESGDSSSSVDSSISTSIEESEIDD